MRACGWRCSASNTNGGRRDERSIAFLLQAIQLGNKQQADAGRKRLKELLTAAVPVFKASKFYLNHEMSLADCAMAPIIWRLPSLDIPLPKDGKAIEDYGNRIFRNPGFVRSLTEKEKTLRDLPA